MKASGYIINLCIFILGLSMIAYYLALGIFVRFGQSLQFMWLLGGGLCILRSVYWAWAYKHDFYPHMKLVWFLRICVLALAAVFLIAESVILFAGTASTPQDLDYIVVLGARVNGRTPSGALCNRIQVAGEYLQDNPNTIAVLSGGQGSDESISEAQCMYKHLTAMGIDPARLILEDQSTDTSENLLYSRKFIPSDARVGLVTNNFHIFRSLALARGIGWNVQGVPVATSLLSMPHYLMREFVGVVYDGLRGNLAF